MIGILDDAFFETTLKVGTVYYYESPRLIHTTEPHYWLIIHKVDSESIIVGCTTTQKEKRIKYLEKTGLPESTLVFIKPNRDNGLKQESLVDCNTNCFIETKDDLKNIRRKSGIEIKGKVAESIIEQLRQGIRDSPVLTQEIKDMLERI